MKRNRSWLALPALLLAIAAPAAAAEIRDKAALFSADAVRKAESELERIEREYHVPITIETVSTLDGEPIREVTTKHAEAADAHGIYLVIAKKEAKIFGEASRGFRQYLPRDRFNAIDKAFTADFSARNFDAGLDKGVAKIGSVLEAAQTEAGGSLKSSDPVIRRGTQPARAGRGAVVPGKSSWGVGSLFSIILGILALFLVIRVVGSLFAGNRGGYSNASRMGGGPGYGPGYGPGGPGYGGAPGGGGGFMNSMFGGIGGALAGNWLYDQFSGNRHGGTVDQTSYDPNAGVAPTEPAAPEWGEGGAGADWGGGAADAGGGGGDWGGDAGGGGGDWGGGGGGDDGASW